MFTGNPKSDYTKFRAALLDAIARKIDPAAGERLASEEYQNVVFLIDLTDKYGKIKVDVRLKNAGPLPQKRVVIARDDWYDRTPDLEKFADEIVAAYSDLLKNSGQ